MHAVKSGLEITRAFGGDGVGGGGRRKRRTKNRTRTGATGGFTHGQRQTAEVTLSEEKAKAK